MADSSFFSGWNADKVLGFGMEAFKTKAEADKAKASKAEAEAQANAYAAASQRVAPQNGIIAGVDNKILFGGGSLALIVVLVLLTRR